MAAKSTPNTTIKFLCSYGGKILPRYPDGKLRYQGGQTRVLSVDRSISFAELMMKFKELCGSPVSLRCQLPTEDLDALISITSDEDLINLVEEYDRVSSLKIRAFLSMPKKAAPSSSSSTTSSSSTATVDAVSPKSPSTPCSAKSASAAATAAATAAAAGRSFYNKCPVVPGGCSIRQTTKPAGYFQHYEKSTGKLPCYYAYGNPSRIYLVHNGNHWQ